MLVLVAFDVKSAERQLKIIDRIKKIGDWAVPMGNVMLVDSGEHSVKYVRDVLTALIEGDEKLMVVNITGSAWATKGVSKPICGFLHEYDKKETEKC